MGLYSEVGTVRIIYKGPNLKTFFYSYVSVLCYSNSDISLSRLSYLNILLDATNREKDFNEVCDSFFTLT